MKDTTPNLIVMLTHNDKTIDNAIDVFEQCKDSQAKYFGIKDGSLSLSEMQKIYAYMKEHNKITVFEIVQYEEEESLKYAKMAKDCQIDIVMGTCYFESVHKLCLENNLKYMPFIGQIHDRPSILSGEIVDIVAQANSYKEKGVDGIDLLGYRYVGNPEVLNETIVSQVDLPIIIAGSIDSYQRLDEMKRISPFAFTIGSAFFDHKFGQDLTEQINLVCDYLKK